ncbi:hypothetical protein Tco_0473298, partial [Tanacetum coccineum]
MTVNKIDVIDMSCDEYSQEVLGFSNVIASGNPTLYFEPILLMEEADSFLALEDDPTSSEVDPTYQDPEGDPTPYFEPIVSTASPTLTPFGDSDFLL